MKNESNIERTMKDIYNGSFPGKILYKMLSNLYEHKGIENINGEKI